MTKIKKLTPEQEAELPAFRARYLDIACGGYRIDRDKLQAALNDAYTMIGKPAPALFIFDSPAACMMALKIFKMPETSQLWSQLRGQLWSQLWSQLRGQLWSQLRSQLGSQLVGQLRSQLGSQLESQLVGQLRSQLGSQLESQLGSQLWNQLRSQLGSQLVGQLVGQLGSQLGSQLDGQLGSQLWSQLRSQLESQLRSQLGSQLGSQLESQLGSQLWNQLWSQLRGQLWSQLRSQLGSQLVGQLRSQLGSQLDGQLGSQLESQLGSQLDGQLWSQLESQLVGQLWNQLWSQLRGQLWSQLRSQRIYEGNYLWGAHDLYWIAFYRFCQRIGVNYGDAAKTLDTMEAISSQCEWWWPFEGVVIASEKPVSVKWDDEQRLHCENGPAVEYADSYALHSWHGQSIPGEWVTGNPPAARDALHWENMDQRAAACEIVGWHNILEQLDAKVIDDSQNPIWGRLVEVDLPDSGRERFLDAMCGTGRRFALPVPPKTKSVDEAQSVLHGGLPVEILKNYEVRT